MPLSTRLPVVGSSSRSSLGSPLQRPPITRHEAVVLALAVLFLVALVGFVVRAPLSGARDAMLTVIFVVDAVGLTLLAARATEHRR